MGLGSVCKILELIEIRSIKSFKAEWDLDLCAYYDTLSFNLLVLYALPENNPWERLVK